MSIISVATTKGGVGKTTLIQCLSAYLSRQGYKVGVLDADPNKGFTTWYESYYEGLPITVAAEAEAQRVVEKAQEMEKGCDVVFIDTAGFSNQGMIMALGTSDGVLIPVGSNASEVREATKTTDFVQSMAKAARRDIPYRIIFTAMNPQTLVSKHTMAEIEKAGYARLQNIMRSRTAYEALTYSGSVPTTGVEGLEIGAIVEEMQSLGWIPDEPAEQAAE